MADKKISALTAMTAPATADFLHIIDDNSGTYTNQKVTLTNLFNKIPTFIGMNSTETVTSAGALSVTTAISLISGAATTLADSSWTTGGNNCRFSSIGAAKVRGRRHVAKLMRDSMLTSKEDNSANDQLRLLERIWGNLARSKHIRGVRYIS